MKYEKIKENRARRRNIPRDDMGLIPHKTIVDNFLDFLLLMAGIIVMLGVIWLVMIYILPIAIGTGITIGELL